MYMIVKVLIEDTANKGYVCEHGFSLYIEYNGKKYLIDSGSTSLFTLNAKKMNVDLSYIDMAFLSHAHYDHSDGFPEFFKHNTNAMVYLQKPSIKQNCYHEKDSIKKYIGINKAILKEYKDRFIFVDGYKKVDDGIYIIPHNSKGLLDRAALTSMYVLENDEFKYDDFSHEQTVVFEENDSLVCFNSCSHSGVDIVIDEVKKQFPNKIIKAYFGGFHMMGLDGASSCCYSKEEVVKIAETLKKSCEATFYSGHCTGTIACDYLGEVLSDRFVVLHSGDNINVI